MAVTRSFLFLQGPYGPFFCRLGAALEEQGCLVRKVVTNGGEWFYWPSMRQVHLWRGHIDDWPQWITQRMQEDGTTDLVLMGDWRALHREAILLARMRGARVWVYEEGYLRPRFVTLEEGGVNGASPLPRDVAEVRRRAGRYGDSLPYVLSRASNPQVGRVKQIMAHFAAFLALWPLFPHYRTHRPEGAIRELTGIIPRYFMRHRRRRDSLKVLRSFLHQRVPFYFMPLQLDSDSQIRRHSPFTGVLESMAQVITSFARHAPRNSCLLIKNHPFDNGLINYRRYMRSLGHACGCVNRLRFIEAGKVDIIIRGCRAVVLCNSTVGLSALSQGRAVYCLGRAIYAMPGLAVNAAQMPLDDFWRHPAPPDPALVADFLRLLKNEALIPGNFYAPEGIEDAVTASLRRMGVTAEDVRTAAGRTEQRS